jgi:hypothetical protein
MAKTDLSKSLLSRYERLEGQRQNWETHWQEVADYMQPRKADVTKQRARGDKRMEQVFDSSPIQAVELLSASLHGMMTNPSTPWFTLRFKDEDIDNEDEAKIWLESATEVMYTAFNRSNFQQEIFELYHDLITFGTAAMFIEEDDEDIIKFSTRHINEVFIAENDKGRIDTIYRRFNISARAAMQKFGEAVSSDVQSAFKKDPYKEVEILHAVYPRSDFNPNKKDKKNMPFESIYFEYGSGHIISLGGFLENPYVIPRYLKASTEQYGRSPGMNALPDVKVLNKMVENSLKAAAKQIDPPLLIPDDGMLAPIRMSPGSINYYRSGSRDRIEPLNINANNNITINNENQRRDAINKMFHIDQLVVTENRNMTATEVLQRQEEKMRILGPVLGRLQSELLSPMIIRIFNILLRREMFMPAPEILGQQELNIEYVSPMALAQRGQELQSLMRGLEIFGSLAQTMPVMDYIDEDGLVKNIISILGLPAKVIKSDQEVQEIREGRAQQEAQMAEQQQQMAETEMAKNAAPMVKEVLNGPQ